MIFLDSDEMQVSPKVSLEKILNGRARVMLLPRTWYAFVRRLFDRISTAVGDGVGKVKNKKFNKK